MSDPVYAVILTAFNPEPAHLEHMTRLATAGVPVIVIDNSVDDLVRFPPTQAGLPLLYRKNRNQGGIAGALNMGVTLARESGRKYVVFLDQDSEIATTDVARLVSLYQMLESEGRKVILGASYYDRHLQAIGVTCKFTRFSYQRVESYDELGLAYVSLLITAGSCASLKMMELVGTFDERLYIDDVDTEYSLRALVNGVQLFMTNLVVIEHSVGSRDTRYLLGVRLRPNNHSSFRRYFIFRNNIYNMRNYGLRFPGFLTLSFARLVHELLTITFFEHSKLEKLQAATVGMWHGIIGRLGAR